MDSKSISREGSRGSSPRPGTTEHAGRAAPSPARGALAQTLLPVLLHELNNHTQHLAALDALLAAGGELPRGGEGLACAAEELVELGWLLGLASGAAGDDLLRERRERAGLAPLARLLQKALRREGRDLRADDGPLPELPPALGWRGAAAVGEWLLACARSQPAGAVIPWSARVEAGALLVEGRLPCSEALHDLARELGGALEVSSDRCLLRLAP